MSNRIYGARHNPFWLVRFARLIGKSKRQISLYFFYRSMNHSRAEAWDKAGRTL